MVKEVKIGLGLLGLLLVAFGGVLAWKVQRDKARAEESAEIGAEELAAEGEAAARHLAEAAPKVLMPEDANSDSRYGSTSDSPSYMARGDRYANSDSAGGAADAPRPSFLPEKFPNPLAEPAAGGAAGANATEAASPQQEADSRAPSTKSRYNDQSSAILTGGAPAAAELEAQSASGAEPRAASSAPYDPFARPVSSVEPAEPEGPQFAPPKQYAPGGLMQVPDASAIPPASAEADAGAAALEPSPPDAGPSIAEMEPPAAGNDLRHPAAHVQAAAAEGVAQTQATSGRYADRFISQAPRVATPPAAKPQAPTLVPPAPSAAATPAQPIGMPTPHSFSPASAPYSAAEEGTYIAEPNDSFWTISEKVYGSGGYFKALQRHNRDYRTGRKGLNVGEKILAPSIEELEQKYPDLCPKRRGSGQDPYSHNMSSAGTSARTASYGGRTYVVQEGDTLFDIAREELGRAALWSEIYNLNRDQLGEDFDHLAPGMRLALPGASSGGGGPTAVEQQPPVAARPGGAVNRFQR